MKIITFISMMLISSLGFSQNAFPIDFESGTTTFSDFDGGVVTVIDNPQSTSANNSAKVAQMVKNAGEAWGGSKIIRTENIDFSTNQVFTMKVYSPRVGVPVLFKLEKGDDYTTAVGKTTSTTVAGEWETLSFDFNGSQSDLYSNITIIFEDGVMGEGGSDWTFYFDDIEFSPSGVSLPSLPIDFESGYDGIEDFDGATSSVLANPQSSGINTSTTVAQVIRDGGQMWAGSKILLDNKIDFSSNSIISMKVFSNNVGTPVLFKLEGPGAATEKSVNTTVAGEWETLTWDFTGTPSDTYNYLVLMFDFGTVGDGTANSTFLFDDIELSGTGLSQLDMPVEFEGTTTNFSVTDFGGNNTILGIDPEDATNNVAITTKTEGAEGWAGTTIGTDAGFANAIPFTATETKISIMVYSPQVGIQVRLKAEDHNDVTLTAETEATTTVANSWEMLTFDFSNVVAGTNPFNVNTNFNKLSIFFNFGAAGAGEVYYWDNIKFVTGSLGNDFQLANNVNIYSSKDNLIIENLKGLTNGKIEVYGITGRKLISKTITNINENISINKQGIFIVLITDDQNNKVISKKIYR